MVRAVLAGALLAGVAVAAPRLKEPPAAPIPEGRWSVERYEHATEHDAVWGDAAFDEVHRGRADEPADEHVVRVVVQRSGSVDLLE